MKKNIKDIIIVTDEKRVLELEKEFSSKIEEYNEKVYNSMFAERNRVNKFIVKSKIARPLDDVYNSYIKMLLHDLHPDLNLSDVKKNLFIRSSGSNKKIIFLIKNFVPKKEIMIEWFTDSQWMSRTIVFKELKPNLTKIKYYDITKGKVSIEGYFERRIRDVYHKKQKIAFTMQMIKLNIELGIYNDDKVITMQNKINKLFNKSKKIH